MISRLIRDRKGQGMVEYGLLIAGVALVCIAGVSMFGHKTSDIIGTTASILPGAHTDDNGSIYSGHIVQTATTNGVIAVDANSIAAANAAGTASTLDNNLGISNNPGTGGTAVTDQTFVSDGPPATPVQGQ